MAGSRGSSIRSWQPGCGALGSWSATSLPSGPRITIQMPFLQPQPLQCSTRVFPAFATRTRMETGTDGPPTSGVAATASLMSVTAGRVGSFPQPDSRITPAIAHQKEKDRTLEPRDTARPSRLLRKAYQLSRRPATFQGSTRLLGLLGCFA